MFELTRYSGMDRPIRRFFETIANDPAFASFGNETDEGNLAIDVSEKGDETIVRADLPGFSSDEINVEFQDGVLTVTAEKSNEIENKDETYLRRERRFTRLIRSVRLPKVAHDGEAKAELRDGVLTVHLPHAEHARPRKIAVS